MKIGCIVMAAGNARRFGSNKLDARVEGKTLLRRALEAVPAACFDRVVVVTQYPQGMDLAREMGFGLEVSGWEVEQAEQGRKNYSVLTLEKLARENPGDELYLAIGSDMLLSFDGWHRWEDILRLAHLEVTSRNIGDDPALHAKARQLDASGARILFAPVEALPMASSVLRTRLAAGEECENELPASVRRVIRREGLYTKGDEVTNESETGKRACAQPAE